MAYSWLKLIHVTSAAISFVLFFLRGVWKFTDSAMMQRQWVKVVPHVNDSLLLAAAIMMAASLAHYPGMHRFLAAKVIGVLVYIALGLLAFRWARSRSAQIAAWLAAQLVFFYVVAVALTKAPLPIG